MSGARELENDLKCALCGAGPFTRKRRLEHRLRCHTPNDVSSTKVPAR